MQRSINTVILLIMSVLMLSGCGSTDPWSLLPSSERVFLEMVARPQVTAQPITVDQLLSRANGDVDAITKEGSDNRPEPKPAKLFFSAPNDHPTIELSADHRDALTPIRDFVTATPNVTIIIEVPVKPYHSRIAAFRRAAAVARYLEKVGRIVRVRPTTDIGENGLRVSFERDT